MLKVIALSLIALSLFLTCTQVEFDNPYDFDGTYNNYGYGTWKELFAENPRYLDDDDSDGIINIRDPQSEFYKEMRDKNPPTIVLIGQSTVEIEKGDPHDMMSVYLNTENNRNVTASDPEGSPVTISAYKTVSVLTINDKNNPYYIKYTAYDTSGNNDSVFRYVNIVEKPADDTTGPILQLDHDTIYLNIGDPFNYPDFYVFDYGDYPDTPDVTHTGEVTTDREDTFTVIYTAIDSKNNKSTATLTVIVQSGPTYDTIAPFLELIGDDTLSFNDGENLEQFKARYVELGCNAWDMVGEEKVDLTASVKISEIIMLNAAFYCIKYNVKDAAGLSAQEVRRIIKTGMEDTVFFPPDIALVYGDSIIQHVKGKAWKEPGFQIHDEQDKDNIDSSRIVIDNANFLANINVIGHYSITYKYTNSVGLEGSETRHIDVIPSSTDREAPVITLKGKNPDTILVQSTKYNDSGWTAWDEFEGVNYTDSVKVDYSNINFNKFNTYSVSYMAKDRSGNQRTITRKVVVVPDLETTDLLVRYNVPSQDPLPTNATGTWVVENIDGTGPDLSDLKHIVLQWDLTRTAVDNFQFYYTENMNPNNKAFNSVTQNFGSTKPSVTFSGAYSTNISGMDKTYYVTMIDGKFIWVEKTGAFAIIFVKKTGL